MNYTSAIFDFNGTLFFDGIYHYQAWKKLAKEYFNYTLTENDMNTKIHGCPNVEAIERLAPKCYTLDEKNTISLQKESYYRDNCSSLDTIQLVDGAVELLDFFQRQHIPFTIASASIFENIEFFYSTFHLSRWLRLEDIIYDNGTYKNKVAMFNDALSLLRKDKESCLIFEDSLSGVLNAIQAGFKNIILLHQHDYNEAFNIYPEVLFHSDNFMDILKFLQEN